VGGGQGRGGSRAVRKGGGRERYVKLEEEGNFKKPGHK